MISEIEPEKIICYSEPFSEMKGDIIYVDYELSSWKHLNDKSKTTGKYIKNTFPVLTSDLEHSIIKKIGYVCKGGGSAFGGDWIPKDENSVRFLGEPNTIKENTVKTTKGNYIVIDKYNDKGQAVWERHLTDHNRPDKHSNPHDHEIKWDNGFPDLGSPINYPDGNILELKNYNMEAETMENKEKYVYNPKDHKFETLGEFKFYLSSGWNIGFAWHGVEYGIEGHNNSFDIWIYDKGDIANNLTLEQTLDYEFDGVRLRDFIATDNVDIIERLM